MEDPILIIDFVYKLIILMSVIFGGGAILIKMGRMMEKFTQIVTQQAKEIIEIKMEVKSLTSLITQVAVHKVEMLSMIDDITMLKKWYDELRHGRGWIEDVEGR